MSDEKLFLSWDDRELRQPLDVGAEYTVLPHLQAHLVGGRQVQEVVHLLVVDLHVADLNGDLIVRGGVQPGLLEQGGAQARDDALLRSKSFQPTPPSPSNRVGGGIFRESFY